MSNNIIISPSLIKYYLACTKKVFYKLYFPDYEEPNVDLIIGRAIHDALEKGNVNDYQNLSVSVSEYLGRYPQFIVDEKEKYKINRCLNNLFYSFSQFIGDKDEIEVPFEYPITCGSDVIYIRGRVDRIINDKLIIDWKTSRKSPDYIGNDPQFIIYHDFFLRKYGRPPESILAIFLYTGDIVKYEHSEDNYNYLFNEIIPSMVRDMKNNNFKRDGIFRNACEYCGFKSFCLG